MDPYRTSQFLLRVETVKYLDRYGFLARLRADQSHFRKRLTECPFPVFDLDVAIDPYEMANSFGNLADYLIREPHAAHKIFHEIVAIALKTLLDYESIRSDQVKVSLRTRPLPAIESFRRIAVMHSYGLVTIRAVLCDHSGLRKRTRTAVWLCTNKCSDSFTTTEYLPAKVPICETCFRDLQELKSERDTVEYFTGRFVDETALRDPEIGTCYGSVRVEISGKLIETLDLGASYVVTGCFDTRGVMSAWDIRKTRPERVGSLLRTPRKIDAVREMVSYSPYRFVHVLASQLGTESSLYPAASFLHLKYGLLLSLASIESDPTNVPISILAVGVDTLSADRLMAVVSRLAPRRVHYTSSGTTPLLGTRTKDGWYESGALCLASSGVCYIGDWEKFVHGQTGFVLRSVIESNTIPIETGYSIPLRAAIWSHWQSHMLDCTKSISKLKTILDLFGFPFLSDADDETHLVDHILRGASRRNLPRFEYTELRTFLEIVNSRSVGTSPEAQSTIKDYFVASRKCRPGVLPIGVVKMLIGLAEAHAKLASREEASQCDALVAVYLCELAVQALFGIDSMKAAPVLVEDNLKIDETMMVFEEWFHCYCRVAGVNVSDEHWTEHVPSPSF